MLVSNLQAYGSNPCSLHGVCAVVDPVPPDNLVAPKVARYPRPALLNSGRPAKQLLIPVNPADCAGAMSTSTLVNSRSPASWRRSLPPPLAVFLAQADRTTSVSAQRADYGQADKAGQITRGDTPTRKQFRRILNSRHCPPEASAGSVTLGVKRLTRENECGRGETGLPTDFSAHSHGAFVHLRRPQDHPEPLPLPSHFQPKGRQEV